MIASITSDLFFFALWGMATFIVGVEAGICLGQRHPPGDGDASAGKSSTEDGL